MRNTALKLTLLLALAAALLAFMTGCSKPTLEKYFDEHKDEATKIEDSMNASGGDQMECTFSVKENTASYVLKFKETYEDSQVDALKDALEDQKDADQAKFTETIRKLQEDSGVEDITLHLEYRNGDDAVIYQTDIKAE